MDNFEWLQGYSHKYGMFAVNFSNHELSRIPKASAVLYSQVHTIYSVFSHSVAITSTWCHGWVGCMLLRSILTNLFMPKTNSKDADQPVRLCSMFSVFVFAAAASYIKLIYPYSMAVVSFMS